MRIIGKGTGARDYSKKVFVSTTPIVQHYQTRVISTLVTTTQTTLSDAWGILSPIPILREEDYNTHWIIQGFNIEFSKNVLFEVIFGFGYWDKLVEDLLSGNFTKPEDYYKDIIVKTYGFGKKSISLGAGYDFFVDEKELSYWLPLITGVERPYLNVNGLVMVRLPNGPEDVEFAITVNSIWSEYTLPFL